MLPDRPKKCPDDAAGGGMLGEVNDYSNASELHRLKQSPNFNWSPELQRGLDILADPIYHGLQIQITGQASCGWHPPTSDPDELERFAREVGYDASYSILTANGRVNWPIPLSPPSSNGDGNPPTRAAQERVARRIPVSERHPQ